MLLYQWIAFNALFGQWNVEKREPRPDRESWRRFSDRMVELDRGEVLAGVLMEHRRLVEALLEDEYLTRYFWEDPGTAQAMRARKAKFTSRTWYVEKNWSMILDRVLERIYLIRCQLAHGAASHNSRLNRTSLKRASMMLGHLVRAYLQVLIEDGADEDWGPLCYPPNV